MIWPLCDVALNESRCVFVPVEQVLSFGTNGEVCNTDFCSMSEVLGVKCWADAYDGQINPVYAKGCFFFLPVAPPVTTTTLPCKEMSPTASFLSLFTICLLCAHEDENLQIQCSGHILHHYVDLSSPLSVPADNGRHELRRN